MPEARSAHSTSIAAVSAVVPTQASRICHMNLVVQLVGLGCCGTFPKKNEDPLMDEDPHFLNHYIILSFVGLLVSSVILLSSASMKYLRTTMDGTWRTGQT